MIGWNDLLVSGESLYLDSILVEFCFNLFNVGSFSISIFFDDDFVFLEVINVDEQMLFVVFGGNIVVCVCFLFFVVE